MSKARLFIFLVRRLFLVLRGRAYREFTLRAICLVAIVKDVRGVATADKSLSEIAVLQRSFEISPYCYGCIQFCRVAEAVGEFAVFLRVSEFRRADPETSTVVLKLSGISPCCYFI